MQIDLDEGKAYFNLVGAVMLNAVTLPNVKWGLDQERKTKVKLSLDFINNSKLIQMWCDLAGYDEEVIKKRLLSKLK